MNKHMWGIKNEEEEKENTNKSRLLPGDLFVDAENRRNQIAMRLFLVAYIQIETRIEEGTL